MDTWTLNERGSCECGSRTFTLFEQIYTNVSLALTPGVLEQYGPIQESEIKSAECGRCGRVWDVGELGEVKLKAIA
jgi:hypothetical protein